MVRGAALVARAQVLEVARATGAGTGRLLWHHVLPACAAPLLVQQTSVFAIAILAEAALSFVGVGPPPPQPSLGSIIADGRDAMVEAPWVCLALALLLPCWCSASTSRGWASRSARSPKKGAPLSYSCGAWPFENVAARQRSCSAVHVGRIAVSGHSRRFKRRRCREPGARGSAAAVAQPQAPRSRGHDPETCRHPAEQGRQVRDGRRWTDPIPPWLAGRASRPDIHHAAVSDDGARRPPPGSCNLPAAPWRLSYQAWPGSRPVRRVTGADQDRAGRGAPECPG